MSPQKMTLSTSTRVFSCTDTRVFLWKMLNTFAFNWNFMVIIVLQMMEN